MVWNWSRCSHKYALQFFSISSIQNLRLLKHRHLFSLFGSENVGIPLLPMGPTSTQSSSLKSPERDLERVETTWEGHYQLLSIASILLCIILNSQACLLPRLSHYSLSSLTFPISLVSSLAFSHSTWRQNHSSKWLWSPPLLISLSSLLLLCRAPLHFPVSQQLPPDASSLRHWGLQYYQQEELSAVLW